MNEPIRKRALGDLLVIGCLALGVYLLLLFISPDPLEVFYLWSRYHEAWQLDELALVAVLLLFSFAVFGYRRFREARLELSARQRAEEALNEAEAKYRLVVDKATVGVAVLQDGMFRLVNPQVKAISGYDREEIISRRFGDLVHPDDRAMVLDYHEKRARSEEVPTAFSFRILSKDGRVRWIEVAAVGLEWAGRPATLSFISDVTDRKSAEEELKRHQDHLEEMVALRTAELTASNEFLRQEISERMRVEAELQKAHDHLEQRVRERTAELEEKIAERQRAEEEKARLENQLRQAQKMEALGTLAGGIAHDFNNILSAIMGYSELALEDARRTRPDPQHLVQIIESAKRAKNLVTQILTFSRKVEPELKPLDLNREIIQIKEMLERTIPKMISIELHLADDLGLVNVDPGQLTQILMNLGTNAKDAMPQGGRLIIETENICLEEEYCRNHLGAKAGDYVLLTVSDTGQGMDRETLEKIFDPFFTRKGVGRGTGLGLATVFGIVKKHRGYIMAYSEPGRGATFKIYLPALEPAPRREPESGPVVKKAPGGSETILLVDDEAALRDLGLRILTQNGYRVIPAENGEEALEIYAEKGRSVDLVILDINMPGMGGVECLQGLLKQNPKAKVIIASGYSRNGGLKDILARGAAEFVAKPFLSGDLLRVVREVLDRE